MTSHEGHPGPAHYLVPLPAHAMSLVIEGVGTAIGSLRPEVAAQ